MTIYFDMDGTIANLYGVENWLEKILNEDVEPYRQASSIGNLSLIARYLNKIQKNEICKIGIISWCCKGGNVDFNINTTKAKVEWLKHHLPSVNWDEIHIEKYGFPKENYKKNKNDILFDDEIKNRIDWGANAYEPKDIVNVLKKIAAG